MAVATPKLPSANHPVRLGSATHLAVIATLVAVVVLAANRAVLGFDWLLFDDDLNVFLNPNLGGLDRETLTWAFSNTDYARRYMPLGWLGFGALTTIDGYNAAVFHVASWLLSGINGALAFLLFHRLLRIAPGENEKSFSPLWQRYAAAAIAALVWSIHPLRAETAGWISGLLYVSNTTCACIALLLHFQASDNPNEAGIARRGLAAFFYLAALLIYPVFLALPAVLVWFAACRNGRNFCRQARAEAKAIAGWWIAAIFAVSVNIYALAMAAGGPYAGFTSLENLGPAARLLNAAKVYLHYVARTFWPNPTSVYYGQSDYLLEVGHTQTALWLVLPFFLAALIPRKSRAALLVGGVAALLSLAPFLGAMNAEFMAADRYAVLWLGIGAFALGRILLIRQKNQAVTLAKYAAAIVGLGCLWPAYQAALAPWENYSTLQARIDQVTAARPHPAMSFARPAVTFWWMGDREESARRLHAGLTLFPHSPRMHEAEADLAAVEPRWRARVGARTSIPAEAIMHYDIGVSWINRGLPVAGARHFKRALILAPQFTEAATALLDARAKAAAPLPPSRLRAEATSAK